MIPYNENAICPACRGTAIGSLYRGGSDRCVHDQCPYYFEAVAHIERRCQRCGYGWPESPLFDGMVEEKVEP